MENKMVDDAMSKHVWYHTREGDHCILIDQYWVIYNLFLSKKETVFTACIPIILAESVIMYDILYISKQQFLLYSYFLFSNENPLYDDGEDRIGGSNGYAKLTAHAV